MSTALALAGVTAVLRDLLNDGLVNHNVSGTVGSQVTVSVVAPDRVVPANGAEASQLNLFLHQVTPNTGWCNTGLPTRDETGQRLRNAPLALDLHYLLSAYSAADLHAEILLGYAMQLLHETPVLTRAAIHKALSPSPDTGSALPPALRALADCGLERQFEQVRISPQYLNLEEISKLWTAMQTHFRPTAAYLVSVVLIEAVRPGPASLPVLSRGPVDPKTGRERGVVVNPGRPQVPTLDRVLPAGRQPAARVGEPVDLSGHYLDGEDRTVVLANDRFDLQAALAADPPETDAATRIGFTIPLARADDFPVGLYRLAVRLRRGAEPAPCETNQLALALVPQLSGLPLAVARDGDGTASFALSFVPAVRAGQRVVLVLGQQEYAPVAFTPPAATLHFVIARAPAGAHLARLRIDGFDSPVIDYPEDPGQAPGFLDQRIVIT